MQYIIILEISKKTPLAKKKKTKQPGIITVDYPGLIFQSFINVIKKQVKLQMSYFFFFLSFLSSVEVYIIKSLVVSVQFDEFDKNIQSFSHQHNHNTKHCIQPQVFFCMIQLSIPFPSLHHLTNADPFSITIVLRFPDHHVSITLQYVVFCIWLV